MYSYTTPMFQMFEQNVKQILFRHIKEKQAIEINKNKNSHKQCWFCKIARKCQVHNWKYET